MTDNRTSAHAVSLALEMGIDALMASGRIADLMHTLGLTDKQALKVMLFGIAVMITKTGETSLGQTEEERTRYVHETLAHMLDLVRGARSRETPTVQ